MIGKIPFEPWHIDVMEVQRFQDVSPFVVDGPAYTFIDGRILACVGIVEVWEGRSLAWAVLSVHAREKMLSITRETKRLMDTVKGRMEITVASDFEMGHRWARLLGYKLEAERMKQFHKGMDYSLYARIK